MKAKNINNFNLAERIDYGVKAGVREAIIEHKRAQRSIFVLKDGEIVEVPPEQIEIPNDPLFPPE